MRGNHLAYPATLLKCLRNLVEVSQMDRIRNEEVRRRAGIARELASRADQRILRWLGYVERMDKHRMDNGCWWRAGTR